VHTVHHQPLSGLQSADPIVTQPVMFYYHILFKSEYFN